jgi:hypothetical protein
MSVIMTARMQGDPQKLERIAAQDPDTVRSIADGRLGELSTEGRRRRQ